MSKIITRVISTFDPTGVAVLNIPNGAESVSLKFYENAPTDVEQQIAVILLIDDPPIVTGTHMREFIMVADGAPVPDGFIKYIATFPVGSNKVLTHCVEIAPMAETGDFNPDTAVVT